MRNSRPCCQDYWHTDLWSYAGLIGFLFFSVLPFMVNKDEYIGSNNPRWLKAPQKGMCSHPNGPQQSMLNLLLFLRYSFHNFMETETLEIQSIKDPISHCISRDFAKHLEYFNPQWTAVHFLHQCITPSSDAAACQQSLHRHSVGLTE